MILKIEFDVFLITFIQYLSLYILFAQPSPLHVISYAPSMPLPEAHRLQHRIFLILWSSTPNASALFHILDNGFASERYGSRVREQFERRRACDRHPIHRRIFSVNAGIRGIIVELYTLPIMIWHYEQTKAVYLCNAAVSQ